MTCALHELPDAAAPLLAADTRRGLMLMRDAGVRLQNGASGWSTPPLDAPAWTPGDSCPLMEFLARVRRGAEGLPLLAALPDHGPE